MIPFPLPVYSDSQFDPDVWDSLVHSNLDLHIAATFTTLDGPTIIFPFTSSEENGGGSINDNSNDNNIDDNNNDDNNSNNDNDDDDNDAIVLLPTIPLPSLSTQGVPVPLPTIPLPSLPFQTKGVDRPLPSLREFCYLHFHLYPKKIHFFLYLLYLLKIRQQFPHLHCLRKTKKNTTMIMMTTMCDDRNDQRSQS